MFHGERSEMGIGNQVGRRISDAQHLLKQLPVLIGRLNEACNG